MKSGAFKVDDLLIPSNMREAATAENLSKWPLMHCSWRLGEEIESMRNTGLQSASRFGVVTNCACYDPILGRLDYAFIAPANFRCNFSGGHHAVLIDPAVLSEAQVRCSAYDIEDVFQCVKATVDPSNEYIGGKVAEQANLEAIVKSAGYSFDDDSDEKELALDVMKLPTFLQYYDRNFGLSPTDLLIEIERLAAIRSYTVFDYFNRTNLWRLSEEILVRDCVDARFLLGHWDCGKWIEWRQSPNPDTQSRLEEFIAVMKVRQPQN